LAASGEPNGVRIVFDPERVSYAELLRVFWEAHDPTQGMRQGNDVGTQYRSAIYTFNDSQHVAAQRSRVAYETELKSAGYGPITTEILPLDTFYFAEDYHQQYLAKNPPDWRSTLRRPDTRAVRFTATIESCRLTVYGVWQCR
jgi:peptide-methionine (S)-S-oxide reductase